MLKIDNKIYLNWDDVSNLVEVLCEKITKIPNLTHVTGLARGGLIPAVLVSHKLNLKYTSESSLKDLPSSNILIIDDICDRGETLKNYKGALSAVLHYKPNTSSVVPTIYAQEHMGNEWVIYPWERKDSKLIQDYKLKNE